MDGWFACAQRNLAHSAALLVSGVLLLACGVIGAYLVDGRLSLPLVVLAHALTILGPTAIKLGYVLRLIAQNQIRLERQGGACVVA